MMAFFCCLASLPGIRGGIQKILKILLLLFLLGCLNCTWLTLKSSDYLCEKNPPNLGNVGKKVVISFENTNLDGNFFVEVEKLIRLRQVTNSYILKDKFYSKKSVWQGFQMIYFLSSCFKLFTSLIDKY